MLGLLLTLMASSPDFENYCESSPNSTGESALIAAEGSSSLKANDLAFRVEGLPPGQFCILTGGSQAVNYPFGNGTLCVSPLHNFTQIGRPDICKSDEMVCVIDNTQASPLNYGLPDGVSPGEAWYFQMWYRDPTIGATFNLTDGVAVNFRP